jgi:hypothetical protein
VERIVNLPDDRFLAVLVAQGTKPGMKPPPDLEELPPGVAAFVHKRNARDPAY